MGEVNVDIVRRSLEGLVPSVVATCDAEGVPNVSMISQVHYVDRDHVALSYQFFNKTRQNLLQTRCASVAIVDSVTMVKSRLVLDYVETRTDGPVFESMKARLSGIASHVGMSKVFRLLGADIFRVVSIETIPSKALPEPYPNRDLMAAVGRTFRDFGTADDLGDLLDRVLLCLERQFGIERSMALIVDKTANRLYTLASNGYPTSGIGSEVAFGEGVIGVAAREGTPIRIGHMTREYAYGEAVRNAVISSGLDSAEATEIAFPGLAAPASQVAIPIRFGGEVLGVLFAESEEDVRFWHDDETALSVIADHVGALIALLPERETKPAESPAPPLGRSGGDIVIRHFAQDDSVFIDHEYLIKGVAGAILYRLVRELTETGRTEFTTRELRLDASLRLPDNAENLDARLVLLRKRLEERGACLRIEKCGRGRFRLVSHGRLNLQSA